LLDCLRFASEVQQNGSQFKLGFCTGRVEAKRLLVFGGGIGELRLLGEVVGQTFEFANSVFTLKNPEDIKNITSNDLFLKPRDVVDTDY
jgi:hypothetical protein